MMGRYLRGHMNATCSWTAFIVSIMLGLTAVDARAVDTFIHPAVVPQDNPLFFPSSDKGFHDSTADLKEILRMALEKTRVQYGPYELKASPLHMTEARYLRELARGEAITIAWSATTRQKEKEFLPVRVPLRKGLLGYRICFIHKDAQARIRQIKTLQDLQKITLGQGIGWGETPIYERYGIPIVVSEYSTLFLMVVQKRIDLYPRGLSEIFGEYAAASKQLKDLAIDDSLVIYHPLPYYFFFNRRDARLADRVDTGLRLMLKDGSFDRIFWKYNKESIRKARLKQRTIIRLENHLLPKETPLQDKSLWYIPDELPHQGGRAR